MMQKQKKES